MMSPEQKFTASPWILIRGLMTLGTLTIKKLYKFSAAISLKELQELSPRVGIIKKDPSGVYRYKESTEKKFSKDIDKKSCLEQLILGGAYLIAESDKNENYHVIYNDMARNYERGALAILTMVKAVYLLPNNQEEKKKMLYDEMSRFYVAEKKKIGKKSQ